MRFNGWVARRAGATLEPFSFEPEELSEREVEIEISHCGICHSDVHLVDGDWGDVFPVVPGHEIVGRVVAGEGHAPGTRVGVGWQRGSCGACEHCLAGEEELCAASEATCMGHFGGFADRIRVAAHFAVPIPEALDGARAAPLLCGGITVWSPLRRFAGTGARVGVIGIGGLGHLALQLARSLGCEVTAFSGSAEKEADAHRFGAHHFSVGPPERSSLDLIINTAPAVAEMTPFLKGLRPCGVFCQVGAVSAPLEVDGSLLIGGRRSVVGSAIGPPGAIAEMLAFAAEHGVEAQVEPWPMDGANDALDRTRRGAARYRVVLSR